MFFAPSFDVENVVEMESQNVTFKISFFHMRQNMLFKISCKLLHVLKFCTFLSAEYNFIEWLYHSLFLLPSIEPGCSRLFQVWAIVKAINFSICKFLFLSDRYFTVASSPFSKCITLFSHKATTIPSLKPWVYNRLKISPRKFRFHELSWSCGLGSYIVLKIRMINHAVFCVLGKMSK